MVDVFEQVEEELRSDRYKRLARKWGPAVGGLLILALVAALAFWAWDSWQTKKADAASLAYDRGLEALMANNPVGAAAAFVEAEKKGDGAYRALALMQQAGLAATENRLADAVELYDRAARVTGDPLIADPARLKALHIVMDTGTLADVEQRVAPLIREGRPLRAFALEAQALARIQHGDLQGAEQILVALQYDVTASADVRERAQAALGQIRNGTAANLAGIVAEQTRLSAQAAAPAPAAPAAAPAAPE